MPHIQDDFAEGVSETIFGVGEVQILDIGGVKGGQEVQHRRVLLLHAFPVGVSIRTQGHHVWGRDQAEVALAWLLERVGVAVKFPVKDRPDRLGIHAVGRHNSEAILREVEVSFILGVPLAHFDSHAKLELGPSIVGPEDGI